MMLRRSLRACLILCGVAASGCLPVQTWEIPQVSGRIMRGSLPLANARVAWITLYPQEVTKIGEATADAHGYFEITQHGRRVWAPLIPIHALADWRLEVYETDASTRVLWRGRHYHAGPRSVPGTVVVECDLDQVLPCTLQGTDHPSAAGRSDRLPVELPSRGAAER